MGEGLLAQPQHVGKDAGSAGGCRQVTVGTRVCSAGRSVGGWVGLFVCSQVQVIKVSGVPLFFFLEKGMKRDH